jgi:MFS family permease
VALLMMNVRPVESVVAGGMVEHLQEGVAYVLRTPAALQIVTLVALLSMFTMNFNILVPVLAKDVLHESAAGFGFLTSAQGIGALVGALGIASISHLGPRASLLLGGAAGLAGSSLLLADARHFAVAAVLLAVAGGSMVVFTATANTSLQIMAPDHLRGRVMSMWAVVMGGVTPAGALIAGGLAQVWGAPGAFGVGGIVGLLAAFAVWRWHAATRSVPAPVAGAADDGRPGDETGIPPSGGEFGTAPGDEE